MRKSFKRLLAMSLVLSMMVLGGCGEKKVTAESLMKDMNANMESVKSVSGDLAMELSMGVSAQGIGMDMDVTLGGSFEGTMDPKVFYMDTTMEMSLMGISMDMEVYTLQEGDTVTTYTGAAGEWTKSEAQVSAEEQTEIQEMYAMFDNAEDFVLAEKTENYNGKEVYVLTSAVTGESIQELLGQMEMEDLVGSYEGMDFSQLSADVSMKIYKDTILPASISVEMTGEGLTSEADGTTVEISGFNVEVNYNSFDDVEEIVIPEEALAAELVTE